MDTSHEAPDSNAPGPSTYVRGYHQLPQEDPDTPSTSDWDSHSHPQALHPGAQSTLQAQAPPLPSAPPPYTPSPAHSSHYSPAPPLSQGWSQYMPAAQTLAPSPGFISQQYTSNNTVIVGQSAGPGQLEQTPAQEMPQDHLNFTICNLILCFLLCNWVSFVCLIPALILSLTAGNSIRHRNYEHAKRSASLSLCCNICVYIQFLSVFIIGLIFLAVLSTVGLGFIGLDNIKIG